MIPFFEPIARVDDWVKVYSQNHLHYHKVLFVDGMPWSTASIVDFGAPAAATNNTTPSTIARAVAAIFQIQTKNHFIQLRARVIDDVELGVFVPGATPRFFIQNWQARVTPFSQLMDPSAKMSEHFIYGADNDAQWEIRSWQQVALARARVGFAGYHFVCGDEVPEASLPKGASAVFVPAQAWGA